MAAASVGSRGRRRAMSEINVTPFVDVMLVLLVIFMVTAPLMQQGVDVALPKTQSATLQQNEEALVVTIKKDGTLWLMSVEVPIAELEEKLKQIFVSRADKDVYLRADDKVAYGTVAKALVALQRAGASRVGMVTQPEA